MRTPKKDLLELNIIEDSKHYILVNKPSGMLSQSDLLGSNDDVLSQINKKYKDVHLLTRLDRPVSGIMLFAKTKTFSKRFLKQQNEEAVEKTYFTLVEGKLKEDETELHHHIYHDKKFRKARISEEAIKGYKDCSLRIKVFERLDNYTLLEVRIVRGKFHQIRAQLSHIGHPVKGDVKYKARRKNKDRGIYLHAHKISFGTPDKGIQNYTAPFPKNDNLWDLVNQIVNKNG